MALTTIQLNNKLIKFREEIIREFIRQNMFSAYMGNSMTSVIRIMNDLKAGGEQVNVPLVNALRATAIGTGTLIGSEEAIDNYGFRMWIDWARNAVKTNKAEIHKDSADIYDIARPMLTDWGLELVKNEIVDTFFSIPTQTAPSNLGTSAGQRVNGISWDNASTSQRNQWTADNVDRVLFGNAVSHYSSVWATAAANVTNTSDKMTAASIRLMKRRAMSVTTQRIRPVRANDGYDYYVCFMDPNLFRDLAGDTTILNNHLYARPREGTSYKDNPLFMDGDILYDGVICRQVPEMLIRRPTVFANAGSSTVPISCAVLCGQSAIAQFYGQLPRPTMLEQTDYQFNRGVGIEMAYGLGKVAKLTGGAFKDWGVFTGFFSSGADP